jgi:hypothetical protein
VKARPNPKPAKKYPNCSLPFRPRPVSGTFLDWKRKNQTKAPVKTDSPKMTEKARFSKNHIPRNPPKAAAAWNTPMERKKVRSM